MRGIVETSQEVKNPASDTLLSLFGFYYLDKSAVSLFADVQPQADVIFIRLADPSQVTEISRALRQQFPFAATTTTEDLRQNYTQLSDTINKLVTVMGLLSLLIGSIGIINTMQVIVRRRTVEVAVLKTLGLQGESDHAPVPDRGGADGHLRQPDRNCPGLGADLRDSRRGGARARDQFALCPVAVRRRSPALWWA